MTGTTATCNGCGNSVWSETISTAVTDTKPVQFYMCLRCDMDKDTAKAIMKDGWKPLDDDDNTDDDPGLEPA